MASKVWRALLIGPGALLCAIATTLGMALWYPAGPAQIDNIAVPLVLFPLVWALLFFYAVLDGSLARAWVTVGLLFGVHSLLVALHVAGG